MAGTGGRRSWCLDIESLEYHIYLFRREAVPAQVQLPVAAPAAGAPVSRDHIHGNWMYAGV